MPEQVSWDDARLWPQFAQLLEADCEALALIDCDECAWSRAALAGMADDFAQQLGAAGVVPATRVLVAALKSATTLAIALAVSRLEAVFCPYSPKLSAADVAVLEERLGHVARVEAADGALRILPPPTNATRSTDPRDATAVLIGFTSGTSGTPKGVIHGAEALNYASRCCAAIAELEPGEAIMGLVPLDSAPGFTFTAHMALSLGQPLVMIDPWVPEEALRRAAAYNAAWSIMVPTQLFTLVEAAKLGLWTGKLPLRSAAVGGSAMTPELIADADRLLGLRALRMFGMSECMGHCSTRPAHSLERRQMTDGTPFPGTEEEAFDEGNKALSRGSRGQAGVRGPSLFFGYADGLGAGQERMTEDGFYLTGDEIIRDEEGFVRVVGRIKDQIIRGGFNIDPAEIEGALLRHPSVAEAAVVAVPERKLGEQACAVCRILPGQPALDLPALLGHLDQLGLSRKKWPEHLVLVEQMAVTATGKMDKKALAAQAAQMLGRA